MCKENPHIPVLLTEVIENLAPKDGGVYVDGTFGNGGYTSAILDKCNSKVIAFDRDENVLPRVNELKNKYKDRFIFFQNTFSHILTVLKENNLLQVDGLVLDIGISSMQIDNAERGFSFRFDAPLSMAMGKNEFDASEVLNNFSEEELADIFYKYGEEPRSRAIAKRIVNVRGEAPLKTTFDLVNLIKTMFGDWQSQKIIPRIFQAIRIFVNDELGELSKILNESYDILKSGGRLVVVDFHSLEDRIVKNFIKENTFVKKSFSRYLPDTNENINNEKIHFKNLQKNVIIPSIKEIEINPRARSAKLRAIEKI